jgi:hypothetical protein
LYDILGYDAHSAESASFGGVAGLGGVTTVRRYTGRDDSGKAITVVVRVHLEVGVGRRVSP